MRRTITNPHGETIAYKFHRAVETGRRKPKKDQRPPILLIGHGVTGNYDRPVCKALAEAAAMRGISALRFSFSGNGESEGKFPDSNVSKGVEDLTAVVDAATEAGFDVSYAGHSMGAAIGFILASEDDRIHNIIGVAAMIHTRRFVDAEFGDVTPGKGNMWGMKGFRLSTAFVDDLKSIDTVLPRVSELEIPLLLVHGTGDDVIPWAEARAAFDFAGDNKQLITIPEANHTFEGERPLDIMAHASTDWLQQRVYPGSPSVPIKLKPEPKPSAPDRPKRVLAKPKKRPKSKAKTAAKTASTATAKQPAAPATKKAAPAATPKAKAKAKTKTAAKKKTKTPPKAATKTPQKPKPKPKSVPKRKTTSTSKSASAAKPKAKPAAKSKSASKAKTKSAPRTPAKSKTKSKSKSPAKKAKKQTSASKSASKSKKQAPAKTKKKSSTAAGKKPPATSKRRTTKKS